MVLVCSLLTVAVALLLPDNVRGQLAEGPEAPAYNETEGRKRTLQIVKSYFSIIRWSPKEEVQPGLGVADTVITHVLGGDYVKLEQVCPALQAAYKDLEKEGEKTMLSSAKYTFFNHTLEYIREQTHRQTHGYKSDNLCQLYGYFPLVQPPDYQKLNGQLISFLKGMKNADVDMDARAFRIISSVKNEKKLNKKVKQLKEKEVKVALNDLAEYARDNLLHALPVKLVLSQSNQSIVNSCADAASKFYAAVAYERQLLQKIEHSKVDPCPDSLIQDTIQTLEDALKFIEYLTRDLHVMSLIINDEDFVTKMGLEYNMMKKATVEVLPFAILSLPSIRKIVLGEINTTPCTKCNCFERTMCRMFTSAVERVRQVISKEDVAGGVTRNCSGVYSDILRSDLGTTDPFAVDFMSKHKHIFTDLKDIEQSDAITEITDYSDANTMYLWTAYTGLPLSLYSVKHGIRWLATFLFDGDCETMQKLQRSVVVLEKYAESQYLPQLSFLERCGLMRSSNPVDSFLLADRILHMQLYQIYRDFDYYLLGNLTEGNAEHNDNTFELMMWNLFNSMAYGLDKGDNTDTILTFEMALTGNMDLAQFQIVASLASPDTCVDCQLYQALILIQYDLQKYRYLNFMDTRLKPFSYENQVYEAALDGLLQTQPPLEDCDGSLEAKYGRMQAASIAVFNSGTMRDRAAIKSYTSYILSDTESQQVTRELALSSIEDMTLSHFDTGLFNRLTKSGIENHDDRSMYDDFSSFESEYTGKNGKVAFSNLWGTFAKGRRCMLQSKGILEYDSIRHGAKNPVREDCDQNETKGVKEKTGKVKGKNKTKNKNKNKNKKKNKNKNKIKNKNKNKNKG